MDHVSCCNQEIPGPNYTANIESGNSRGQLYYIRTAPGGLIGPIGRVLFVKVSHVTHSFEARKRNTG